MNTPAVMNEFVTWYQLLQVVGPRLVDCIEFDYAAVTTAQQIVIENTGSQEEEARELRFKAQKLVDIMSYRNCRGHKKHGSQDSERMARVLVDVQKSRMRAESHRSQVIASVAKDENVDHSNWVQPKTTTKMELISNVLKQEIKNKRNAVKDPNRIVELNKRQYRKTITQEGTHTLNQAQAPIPHEQQRHNTKCMHIQLQCCCDSREDTSFSSISNNRSFINEFKLRNSKDEGSVLEDKIIRKIKRANPRTEKLKTQYTVNQGNRAGLDRKSFSPQKKKQQKSMVQQSCNTEQPSEILEKSSSQHQTNLIKTPNIRENYQPTSSLAAERDNTKIQEILKARQKQQSEQKKREQNLLMRLREQFSEICFKQPNQDEKRVSEEIRELQQKLGELVGNNAGKTGRHNEPSSPVARVVKLNLTPSRAQLHKNTQHTSKSTAPRSPVGSRNPPSKRIDLPYR